MYDIYGYDGTKLYNIWTTQSGQIRFLNRFGFFVPAERDRYFKKNNQIYL